MSIQACSLYINYQLLDKYSRVGFLLDSLKCNSAALQAVIAMVEEDNEPGRKRNYFEGAATHILPKDLVTKKRLLAAK